MNPNTLNTAQPLGLCAWAEWETHLQRRDQDIAAAFGFSLRAVSHMRETNMAAWEWYEGRERAGDTAPQLNWREHKALSAAKEAEDGFYPCSPRVRQALTMGDTLMRLGAVLIAGYFVITFLIHHF